MKSQIRSIEQPPWQGVLSIPTCPTADGAYAFAGLSRDDVNGANHGLHKYPAKFVPQIPQWALRYDPKTSREVVLDPFCGSGTTLVEQGIAGGVGLGIDISPLATLITRAKTSLLEAGPKSSTDLAKA